MADGDGGMFADEPTPFRGRVAEERTLEEADRLLLDPSGGIEAEDEGGMLDDPDLGMPRSSLLASFKEMRGNALALLVEPVRQGFCDACGKRALVEALPVMLTMLLVLFDSQTQSKLTVEEMLTLRRLLGALLEGVREAHRAATGAAAAPFNALQEVLPPKYAELQKGVETKGFRLKWPRLFADATATVSTPTVETAYEFTNTLALAAAVAGLLECVQEYGEMYIASEWALVARSWLDASSDATVRFKTLAIVRLLIPHIPDDELDAELTRSVVAALHSGLAELAAAQREEERSAEQQRRSRRARRPSAARCRWRRRGGGRRRPQRGEPRAGRAQAARARPRRGGARGAPRHCKRKAAARALGESGGLGGVLLWTVARLSGTIYPTLLAEVYPMLELPLRRGPARPPRRGRRAAAADARRRPARPLRRRPAPGAALGPPRVRVVGRVAGRPRRGAVARRRRRRAGAVGVGGAGRGRRAAPAPAAQVDGRTILACLRHAASVHASIIRRYRRRRAAAAAGRAVGAYATTPTPPSRR